MSVVFIIAGADTACGMPDRVCWCPALFDAMTHMNVSLLLDVHGHATPAAGLFVCKRKHVQSGFLPDSPPNRQTTTPKDTQPTQASMSLRVYFDPAAFCSQTHRPHASFRATHSRKRLSQDDTQAEVRAIRYWRQGRLAASLMTEPWTRSGDDNIRVPGDHDHINKGPPRPDLLRVATDCVTPSETSQNLLFQRRTVGQA